MSVNCKCCVLLGTVLCNGPITRPEEPDQLWCVIVCDLEHEAALARVGLTPEKKSRFPN
jgi:hypothetical protein